MYYEDYYEPSVMDEILDEFRQKCKEVLLDDINTEIGAIKHTNECLRKENDELKKALSKTEKDLRELKKNTEKFSLMETLVNGIKNTVENSESKDEKIYGFLDLVFKRDYIEQTYDAPLWIGAMTQFYSNREKVIEVLKLFDIKLPNGIENFRLPIDWNEKELDIFFDTMHNHYNCNCSTYEGNLGFWGSASLEDVKTQCNRNYSQIPWQYVLRNPLLKKEKYLKKIGKNAYGANSYSGHWVSCYKIDHYLDLSDEEIKTILNNIDYTKLKNNDAISKFVLRNLKCIENEEFLNKVYSLFRSSYEFGYGKKILEMPYKYMLQWVCDNKNSATNFIENNKENFTEEQRKELLMKALGL
jgi:hypothetical protein